MPTGTTGTAKTGTTGPTGPEMKSFVVGYRTKTAGATMAVEAQDREHAIEAALAQISAEGEVEILQAEMLPGGLAGAGPTGAAGPSGPSGATGA